MGAIFRYGRRPFQRNTRSFRNRTVCQGVEGRRFYKRKTRTLSLIIVKTQEKARIDRDEDRFMVHSHASSSSVVAETQGAFKSQISYPRKA